MGKHHVVHRPDLGGVEGGVFGVTHGQDVAESLPVALDLREGLLIRTDGFLAVQGGRGIVFGDDVTFDAVGTLDGAGECGAAQGTFPASRRAQDVPQLPAHLVDLT